MTSKVENSNFLQADLKNNFNPIQRMNNSNFHTPKPDYALFEIFFYIFFFCHNKLTFSHSNSCKMYDYLLLITYKYKMFLFLTKKLFINKCYCHVFW